MKNRYAFTLIELLVVVLIIGILAAVAMPQYQKAVRKARFTGVITTLHGITQGIDAYIAQYGYPSGEDGYIFHGPYKNAELDVSPSCSSEDEYGCYTKEGLWSYSCGGDMCDITLATEYGSDWLKGGILYWNKIGDGPWGMLLNEEDGVIESLRPEVCRWWVNLYGEDRVVDFDGSTSNSCNAYL